MRRAFTFFPAYLPRVMMATRPTLRTVIDQVSISAIAFLNLRGLHSHFISTVVGVDSSSYVAGIRS